MSSLSWARNLGDPGKVKGMFKSKSSVTTRQDSFFSWKSDDLVVVMKWGNAHGAKGITKFGLQTTHFALTEDSEPEVRRNQ